MNFDPKLLGKLLVPLLTGIDGQLPPTTPPYVHMLIQLGLAALAQASGARMAVGPGYEGHDLLSGLPPEHRWTPENLVEYARSRAA